MLAGAALALKTRHTAIEHAARQELTELALDELREACAVAGRAAAGGAYVRERQGDVLFSKRR